MQKITSLDELKQIELSVLKKVHQFCDENGIRYFLCLGTLLGAIRHGGFIPWDDDIDIYMKRREYQKFIDLWARHADELSDKGVELVNRYTKRYYGRIISKVIDTGTVLTEPEYKTDDPIGVFIDIWPLDGTPNNKVCRKIYIVYAKLVKKLLLASSMKNLQEYSIKKKFLIKAASVFKPEKLLNHLDRIAQRYEPENSDYLVSYNDLLGVYRSGDFRKRIRMKFEDQEFWVPAEYDSVLTADYGNYMELPPENERVPNHVIDAYYK